MDEALIEWIRSQERLDRKIDVLIEILIDQVHDMVMQSDDLELTAAWTARLVMARDSEELEGL